MVDTYIKNYLKNLKEPYYIFKFRPTYGLILFANTFELTGCQKSPRKLVNISNRNYSFSKIYILMTLYEFWPLYKLINILKLFYTKPARPTYGVLTWHNFEHVMDNPNIYVYVYI